MPQLWSLLDEQERARASRFAFESLRVRYVVAHAALRLIIGSLLGRPAKSLRWQLGTHGKPALEDGVLEFNLSHSRSWGLIGVGYGRAIGVDIEAIDRALVTPSVLETVASARERLAISKMDALGRDVGFHRLWVRKEATLKALGTGLSMSPRSIEVPVVESALGQAVAVASRPESDRCLRVWDVAAPPGYVASIAIEHDSSERPRRPRPLSLADIEDLLNRAHCGEWGL